MRRNEMDLLSQPIRNLFTNPLCDTPGTATTFRTNLAQNPSFETTSGTVDVRTNLHTNPAFETTAGMTDVRTNWIPNSSFAATSANVNVRTNLALNPAMEASSGTTAVRTNWAVNPKMTNTSLGGYQATGNTLTSLSTGVTGQPDLITTAVRVAYTTGSSNPGAMVLKSPDVNTQYTVSAWVYNEGPNSESIAVALAGVASGGQQTVPVAKWTRLSWTTTTPSALGTGNDFGVRIGGTPTATGSFLVTGVLAEKSPVLGDFFDGTIPAYRNLVAGATTALSGVTITTGIAYSGQTWSRASVATGTNGWIARQYVNLSDLTNGETYTASVTVANDTSTATTIALDWSDTPGASFTIQPGETRRVKVTGTRSTYDTTFRFADLQVNQDASGPRSILFKDWTIEHGATDGTFYTGTGDFTYSWSGTADASISYQLAPTLTGWNASNTGASKAYQTTRYGITGKSVALSKAGGYVFLNVTLSGLSPSASYTWSADVVSPQATINTVDRGPSGGTYSPADRTVTPNVVTRISRTFTTGAGETTRQISIAGWENASAPDGSIMYIDNVVIELSTLSQPYFDGSTAASGDFTFAWAGTPNASVSYQQAPGIASWLPRWYGSTGGAGVFYQAKGGPSGTYGRKLWTVANTGSSMDTGINTGNITAWANTPYTLSAWVRCSVDQVYQFYIDWKDSGGTLISSMRPTQTAVIPANTWTRISISGTSPANTAMAQFIVGPYNGATAMPAGATIDFDNVMAEMYPVVRDYFDTANPLKNLCTNPSFDVDTSGWTASNMVAGHGRNTARSWSGVYGSVWGVATDNLGDSMYTNTVPYDVNEGAIYTVSAYVWVPAGVVASDFRGSNRNLWAVAANTNMSSSLVTQANIDFSKTNQWQRLSTTITIPSGLTRLNVRLYFPANSLGVYWDAVLVEKTDILNPYYSGQGGFTYVWSGATNNSYSIQQAPKPATVGSANQAVVYQVGTPGKYKTRMSFTGNTVSDSGVNFGGGIATAPNKTYTVAMNVTSESTRAFRFSAQGTGVVFASSGPITATAGIPTRQIWSFSTTASGSFALYVLRTDGQLGYIDIDSVQVEEGPMTNGGYFNGARVDQNLFTNSTFEIDTSTWSADTGSPTLTASTDMPYLGTKSLKLVSTVVGTDVAAKSIALTAVKPSTTYTLSYYVYSPDARTSCYFDLAATNFSLGRVGATSVAASAWKRVSGTFTTPDTMGSNLTVYLHHTGGPNVAGATVFVDCVLLEESDTLNQFYEGAGDFTYAWTGTPHASTSVQRGVAPARANSERAFGVSTTRNGDKVVRVIPAVKGIGTYAPYTGNDVFINLYYQPPSLKPNTTYTVVATCVNEAPLSAGAKFRFNIDGLDQYSATQQTTVGEYTINWQFTTGGSALVSFMRFMPGPSGVPGYTNEVILKNLLIVEGTYIGPYFDGATAAANDYTYRWTGTANDSTSELRATPPLKIGWLNAIPATSTDWSSSGTKSVKVSPAGASTDSFAYLTIPPLENGKTYTITATMRMTAPQTGTIDTRARRIDVFHSNGYTLGPQAPNVAGVSKVSCTFTVTDKNAYTNARLYNGASVGNGDVWYDDIMLVEGNYTGDFINPSQNPFAKWDGTVSDSTSVGYAPQLLDVAGKPFRDITTSMVIPNAGHIPDMGPRTVYVVYEAFGYTASYNGIGYYGDSVNGGRITFQTAASGQNLMGVRLDFTNGEFNKVFSFTGGRSTRRHVLAMTISNGLTSFTGCLNGAADQTALINGGTGWNSNYTSLSTNTEITGLRMFVFYAEHDRSTRLTMSRYLGNKYGASVA